MKGKVRVGIIGTGWGLVHGECLKNCDSAEIVGVCGTREEKTREAAHKLGNVDVYTDYKKLLDRDDLDAIIIASPDDLHYSMAIDAVNSGKHVLCEKPLARNADDARDIWQRAKSAAVINMTMFSLYWQPQCQYLKQLINDGYVGTPKSISTRWIQSVKLTWDQYMWRYDQTRSEGTIADLGAHCFFINRWLMGPITTVQASLRTYTDKPHLNGKPVQSSNDAAFVLLGFENGAHGSVAVSQATVGLDPLDMTFEIEVTGDKGTLRAHESESTTLSGKHVGDDTVETIDIPSELTSAYGDAVDAIQRFLNPIMNGYGGAGSFVRSIVDNTPGDPSFEDGFLAQEIIDAAIHSNNTGATVKL